MAGSPLRLSLSLLKPAGYITVNYDYELWAELERQGARFLTGPAWERLLVESGPFVDNPKNKEETRRRLCVLNPRRRRSDACKREKGRELRLTSLRDLSLALRMILRWG